MAERKTPPINTKGRYEVRAPYIINAGMVYECVAIRLFTDITILGIDVYNEYYKPVGINEADYKQDERLGAAIITLQGANDELVYVPDTYILFFPQNVDVPYTRFILSADLGLNPNYYDLTPLKAAVASTIADNLGITPPVVNVGAARFVGNVTPEQHELNEAARAMMLNNRIPDSVMIQRLTAQVNNLLTVNQQLTAALIAKGA